MTTIDDLRAQYERNEAEAREMGRKWDAEWEAKRRDWAEQDARRERNQAGPHPLEAEARGALAALEMAEADLERWKDDKIYSDDVKQQRTAEIRAAMDEFISGKVTREWLTSAQTEFETLVKTRRDLTERGRLADPLNNPVSMANASARLKNMAAAAQNLAQFQRAYENARAAADPYLLRAFQTEAAQYVSRYQEPAGGFMRQLENDYEANFLAAADREALDWKLARLRDGLRQAASAARSFFRRAHGRRFANAMEAQPANSPDRVLETLLWQVSSALQGDPEAGFHGGVYAPDGLKANFFGGER